MKKIFLILFFCFVCIFCSSCQKKSDKITLRFSTWGSQTEYAVLENILTEYENSHPKVKIELIHVPEQYFRKIHLLFASNAAPDVIFINNLYAPLYFKAGLLEDLSEITDTKDFFESSINAFSSEGKLYALPRDISGLVIFYNKDLFKKYGISFPTFRTTLEDLRKIAAKFPEHGIFGLNYETDPLFLLPFMEYFGGSLVENGKVNFTSENTVKGLQFYADMANIDKSVPKKSDISGMTSSQMFLNSQIAMMINGRWTVPKLRELAKFDWDIVEFPQTEKSKNIVDASGWAVAKSSKHKKEAFEFVKFLSSEYVSKKFTATGLITPARINVAQSTLFLSPNLKPKNSLIFVDTMKNSKPAPVNLHYAKITDIVAKALESSVNEGSDIRRLFLEIGNPEKLSD